METVIQTSVKEGLSHINPLNGIGEKVRDKKVTT